MVASAVAAAALVAAPAAVAQVHVVADPWAHGGALGLLVPGHGVTVTRADALAELAKQRPPAGVEVYVALPPPGRTHNIRRYPIAVVGPGYSGLLTSSATRVPGLVSIRDLDRLSSQPDANPRATLLRLDRRLHQAHDARNGGILVVMFSGLVLAGLALLFRSAWLARAGVLSIPAALSAALLIAALGGSRPAATITALVGPDRRRGARPRAASPARGGHGLPRPLPGRARGVARGERARDRRPAPGRRRPLLRDHERGGDAAARTGPRRGDRVALAGRRARARERGLEQSRRRRRRNPRLRGRPRDASAAAGRPRADRAQGGRVVVFAVALGLALVGIDAALGGSSHVDRAVGGGPGTCSASSAIASASRGTESRGRGTPR